MSAGEEVYGVALSEPENDTILAVYAEAPVFLFFWHQFLRLERGMKRGITE